MTHPDARAGKPSQKKVVGWGAFSLRAVVVSLASALLLAAVYFAWFSQALNEAPSAIPSDEAVLTEPHGAGADEERLKRPPLPPGFNQFDAGFIKFGYPPEVRQRIQVLIDEAPAIRDELASRFGRDVLSSVVVHIARTPGEMVGLAPVGAPYPSYASGVAYSSIGFVLLTIHPQNPSAPHDLREVFRHELAHVALFDALDGHRVPRWFNEGFAIHLSRESSLARTRTLWTAVLAGDLLPLKDLDRNFPSDSELASLAYAESADVVRHLLRTRDMQRFTLLLNRLKSGDSFEVALSNSYGMDLNALEYEWREELNQRYSFWPILLSGSLLWIGAIGLFALAWQRRRKKHHDTLARWAAEEKREDLERARASKAPEPRLHIVLSPRSPSALQIPPPKRETDVPKVEHDGSWYTLH